MEEENKDTPVFDLTLISVSDKSYVDTIKSMCENLALAQNSILSVYWAVGTILHEFINSKEDSCDSKTVSAALRELSSDVHIVSGGHLEYSDSTLRKMLTFRESITKDQLKRLKSLGVPISKALPMCIGDVSNDDRDDIIEGLESGATNTAQIGERIEELCPKESRDETRGGAGPFQTIKKFNTSLDKLSNMTEDDLTLYTATVMGSDDEDARVNFTNQLTIAKNKINSLERVFSVLCDAYLGSTEEV